MNRHASCVSATMPANAATKTTAPEDSANAAAATAPVPTMDVPTMALVRPNGPERGSSRI
jgi:hypothetical protein